MQNLTQPTLLLKPFCQDGDKNQIPVQNDSLVDPQLADLTNGFPEITSKPPSQGGLPPERRDFNALGYLTTSYDWFYQAGGTFTFNQTISDSIGGYPLNARLWYVDNNGLASILRSTIENNTNNFLTDSSVIGEVGSGKPWVIDRFRGLSSQYNLFDTKWSDYELDDQSWLRADTFSWQDGTVYSDAYQHLSNEWNTWWQSHTVGDLQFDGDLAFAVMPDGHRICGGIASAVQEQEEYLTNLYNSKGVAWYYLIDTTNQRFKLPRTKWGFVGVRDDVGKYVAPGLPNITGYIGVEVDTGVVGGAFYKNSQNVSQTNGTGGNINIAQVTLDASRSSSIYGNSTTVQQCATQMYLYFYVGQFTQTATEQTAGLNTELFNSKVDLNAANLSTAGKSLISGLGMPSNSYIDLTLGANNSTYTAPSNGYFTWQVNSTATNQYFGMINQTSQWMQSLQWTPINGGGCHGFLPVRKGDIVLGAYTATNVVMFRFVYAEGEQ